MNALTGSDTLVENKLFATLDPLTRRIKLAGAEILLTDTVGFISNLPHQLIDAFKSTLEEAAISDALLIVIDASDPNALSQAKTVKDVLQEIGADEKKTLVALNKIDAVEEGVCLALLKDEFVGAVEISAKTGLGLDLLKAKISAIIKE